MDLPTVLYRCPGHWSRPGGTYDYLGIETPEAYESAIAEGWQLTMPAAIEAYENKVRSVVAQVKAEVQADLDAAPSIAATQPDKPRGKPGPKPKVKDAS